jgi:hypothetical protein
VRRTESAFGALYTNDNKAELMIVVTVVICRLTQKYAQMQHPLFGMSVWRWVRLATGARRLQLLRAWVAGISWLLLLGGCLLP